MERDRAIEYINELLNSEYDLMQDRKLDSNYESDKDLKESTEFELDEIVNAQKFMEDI
mgnify:CR=1 FL=1